MSYARYAAAAADVEALSGGTRLQWKLRQAQAELRASLPFLGDDIFVLIAAELDITMLGRLACAAQRFWRKSVPDPAHKGSAPPELWSVAEEGARRRLAAQRAQPRAPHPTPRHPPPHLLALRRQPPPRPLLRHRPELRRRAALVRRVGDALPPEALRRAAEAAEHAGVELGGDENEDVVAEEGERWRRVG